MKSFSRNFVLAAALTTMAGTAAIAQPYGYTRVDNRGYANRVVEGTVASVVHVGNGERVRLTNGMDLVIPPSIVATNEGRRYGAADLHPGDVVRMNVFSREGDGRDARVRSLELLRTNNAYGYGNNGYGNRNGNRYQQMNGTVVSVDRRANLLTLQTDRGRTLTVEAGRMSTRGLHRGDRVTISGQWNGSGNVIANDIRRY